MCVLVCVVCGCDACVCCVSACVGTRMRARVQRYLDIHEGARRERAKGRARACKSERVRERES